MKTIFQFLIPALIFPISMKCQNIALSDVIPVAKLHVQNIAALPSIPGSTSTGLLRVATGPIEGVDFGKSNTNPWAGWIQAGYQGTPDPLSLQAAGGNLGIGTINPSVKLDVAGDVKVNGKVINVSNPTAAQDAANKAYVTLLEAQVTTLEGLKDIDNNRYDVVTIGSQVWMADNLQVTRYNDGTAIPLVTNGTTWSGLTTAAYTWYNNDASDYGALYNFPTVADANPLNVCPVGWHVPSNAEVVTLNDFLFGNYVFEGGAVKESGLAHWDSPNVMAHNETGLTLLPGGYRLSDGTFVYIDTRARYWTSQLSNPTTGFMYAVNKDDGFFYPQTLSPTTYGLSVRCIKD